MSTITRKVVALAVLAAGAGLSGGLGGAHRAVAADAGTRASVPVYYVGIERIHLEGGGVRERPKLYREFHRLPVGDGTVAARTRAAVAEAVRPGSAYDPDYRGHWPAGTRVRSVRVDGDTVVVDLAGAARAAIGGDLARRTVEQLVWTVTAASGRPGVRLLLDGAAVPDLWGVTEVRDVMRRGDAVATLALVWLIDPQQGARVGRTFEVFLAAMNPHESTAYVRVRQGDRVVFFDYVQMSGGAPSQATGRYTVTLPPGRYTVEAFELSMADGSMQAVDDHVVTVG